MKSFIVYMISYLWLGILSAQYNTDNKNRIEKLIEASQAGAMPLLFAPSLEKQFIPDSGFRNEREFFARRGLPNFFRKAITGKPVVIGYIGGSITRADQQYRTKSANFLQGLFPAVKMRGVNAGVSGTGSDLGACRIQDQLLQYRPDLVFVEFAVNGAFAEGVEGIIRQIWNYNPYIDICLLYTISTGQTNFYREGKMPPNIATLEKLADHYQIPSVHLGLEAALLEKEGKLLWKADPSTIYDKIVFSEDGVHPTVEGGNLYASAIARAMLRIHCGIDTFKHAIVPPVYDDNWEDAKMISPIEAAQFTKRWKKINPMKRPEFVQFAGWFPYIMKADRPNESMVFQFKGSMFGIFDIGGPEVGQLTIQLDGKNIQLEKHRDAKTYTASFSDSATSLLNRFNEFCNNRHRGQTAMIRVKEGVHTVKISIAPEHGDKVKILGPNQLEDITKNPEKYNQKVIYIGKILVRGKLLPIH